MSSDEAREEVAAGFRRLFEPLQIGNFTVRNRIVNTTHGTGLGVARDLRYIQERARGGVGLIGLHARGSSSYAIGPGARVANPDWDMIGYLPASPEGIAQIDESIPSMRERAAVVHREGAKCFAQLLHLGAGRHTLNAHPPVAPSAVADPYEAHMPHVLNDEEIEQIVLGMAHDIRRAAEGDHDAAEIHGAHGYLVNEFLSPYFNRRTDKWGGSTENRVRFVLEVIAAARKMVDSDYPIGIRIGVDGDGVNRGITVDELAEVGRLLAPHVAYLSISGGNYSGFGDGLENAYVSPWYKEPGFNVAAAAAVRKVANGVPVFVTGRIADPAIAEGILADGAADMIGMVRGLIADPDLPNKARTGRAADIRMCLGLSECHHIGPHRTPVSCAVNAAAAREDEMQIEPAATPKTVVIVGAGPAGLEAARVAALRGHRVFLADSKRTLGGTPAVLALDPNRRNLRDHLAFFENEFKQLDIEFMLGNQVSVAELVSFSPDAVVIATGGIALMPEAPGIADATVLTALDVLNGAPVGDRVLVVGGLDNHLAGPTIAEYLVDQGKDVEWTSEHLDFARGAEDGTRLMLAQRLLSKGVRTSMLHKLSRIDSGSATVVETFSGKERELKGVTVVVACGLLPDSTMADELRGQVPEVHLIGDALAPRRIMHATLEGARAAQAL